MVLVIGLGSGAFVAGLRLEELENRCRSLPTGREREPVMGADAANSKVAECESSLEDIDATRSIVTGKTSGIRGYRLHNPVSRAVRSRWEAENMRTCER